MSILKKFVNKILFQYRRYSLNENSIIKPKPYIPSAYWEERLGYFGENLKGPGRIDLSEKENRALYQLGEKSLENIISLAEIQLHNKSIAEIGCGNGYWTNWISLHESQISYTGYDITDIIFNKLDRKYPTFKFQKLDITQNPLPEKYFMILMLDVTQHITNENAFQNAMKHVSDGIILNGCFITTSWLSSNKRNSIYEKSRNLSAYQIIFKNTNWKLSGPQPFRDKYIICFKKIGDKNS